MREDLLKYAVENLTNRSMRSWLTVLSILIGIMAIFALMSFGFGLQNYVNTLSEDMGVDKLMVQAGGFQPPGTSTIDFDEGDLDAIHKVKGVKAVTGMYMTQLEIKYDSDKPGAWAYVMGIDTRTDEIELLQSMLTVDLELGRELNNNDKYKVTLGNNYLIPDKIYSQPLKLRDTIYIKDTPFKVVGFYESLGNPGDDANVYIPIDTAHEIFETDSYNFIYIQSSEEVNAPDLVPKIEKALRKYRNQEKSKEDFTVQTFEEAIASFSNIIQILNVVLVLIALISVVVSAVNIANSMFTAVLERTNEIGVMKAIGAKNDTIMTIFLIESGILGLVGGAIGVFLGYLISSGGGRIAAEAGYSFLKPIFPWWLILGCLIFSFSVGMLSGYFPARQAARLKPVDALRYE